MGYNTRYTLEVKAFTEAKKSVLTVQDMIKEIEQSENIDRAQLLKNLKQIESGKAVALTNLDIIAKFRKQNENAAYAFDDTGTSEESCKWYENTEELKTFSLQYPDWIFTLKGEGEEAGDLWIKYFFKGRVQVAKAIIKYEDFDMKKLT